MMQVDNSPEIIQKHYPRIILCILILYVVFSIFYIFFGMINEDEGWYLYAGKLVYQCKVPYSDFFYSQSPVLPYIYGIPQQILGTSLYLGRFISLSLGMIMLLFTIIISNRIAGKLASVIAGAAITSNLFIIYFNTITKTYVLTELFFSISIFFLVSGISKYARYALSAFFLCLAAGTRLSVITALPVFLIYIIVFEKNKKYFVVSAGTVIITLAMIFLPFMIKDMDLMAYNIVGYHMTRYNASPLIFSIIYKIATLFSIVQIFSFMIIPIAAGLVLFLVRNRKNLKIQLLHNGTYVYLYGILGAVFFSHFIPGGSYDEYQVVNTPLFAVLAGSIYSGWYQKSTAVKKRKLLLAFLCAFLLLNSAVRGALFIDLSGRRLPLDEISEMSECLQKHISKNETVFTYHTYIAIQSDRNVSPGLEIGIFSYFPEWDTRKARRYHVNNNQIALELIASPKTAAVIVAESDFTFSGSYALLNKEKQKAARDEIMKKIEELYYPVKRMDRFGQVKETIYCYVRKNRNRTQ